MLFVIVEYPDTTFGASFTATRPGVTIDSISQAATGPEGNRRHPAFVLARGLSPQDLRMLVTGFQHIYDDLTTVEQDLAHGRWAGRFTVRERALAGSTMHKILAHQDHFGTLWTHAEGGVVHLRARVHDRVAAERLAETLGQIVAADGSRVQAEAREMDAHDHSVWDDLVQQSVGLSR